MQRTQDGGIIISCDFCGTDWDAFDQSSSRPMVEGHHGSVLCLECLRAGLEEMSEPAGSYKCALCLQELDAACWSHPDPPAGAAGLNPGAVACRACLRQAAGRFNKDPDVAWTWDRA
ncbi:MAG: hypothetical protein OER86_02500 [Phycisphaerae bacterium]|nr:hypothetical protein [Phycisphaerae bacterium]